MTLGVFDLKILPNPSVEMFRHLAEAFETENNTGNAHLDYVNKQNAYYNAAPTMFLSRTSGLPGFDQVIQTSNTVGQGIQNYANKGVDSRTYTQPSWVVSSNETFEDVPNTFNYPGTVIDPIKESGSQFAQNLGGVASVKQKYDEINRLANDNSKTNTERATALKQAYNITLGQPSSSKITGPTQVFAVGPGYDYTKGQAQEVCAKYGATVATTAQLQDAYAHGADWCFSGWVADGGGKWPITTSAIWGCGGRPGIIEWTPDNQKAGVTCYGPKPGVTDPASQNGTIKAFNQQMWDRPTEATYLTVPSGYLETTGPQPSCFSGLSVDAAQKGCNALGAQCAGFSYSKDGAGNGCYKGNHNAGINGNPAYMGYVKTPIGNASTVTTGRYIKLQYNRVECLNLAEIKVYSKKNGPNIITPNTPVTKSSGFQGDVFPSRNFVDGDTGQTYNFVHTSCGDVPWIQVDLGSMINIYRVVVYNRVDCCHHRIHGAVLQILNDENDMIYVSNPINSVNMNYTWFPPNLEIKADLPEDMRLIFIDTPGNLSWINSVTRARAAGNDARLPTHAEVRKYIADRGNQPLYNRDVWWPVIDSPNAWVSVGNYDTHVRLGNRHEHLGGPPGWGPTSQHFAFRTVMAIAMPNT
jgi:hypothetical protein